MSNVAQIKRPDQAGADPLHAERAALDAAIKMAWRYTTAVSAARSSLDRGRDLVAEAEARVEAARTAIDTAREADGKAAAKALRQRDTVAVAGASALKTARRALADAEDDVDVARSALSKIEAELADAEAEQRWRANVVVAARAEVLRPFAEKILEKAARLRRDYRICEALAAEILDRDVPDAPVFDDVAIASKAQAARTAPFGDLRKQASFFFVNHRNVGADDAAAVAEAVAALRSAIAALGKDPATELPLP